jgi:hypothetical protein
MPQRMPGKGIITIRVAWLQETTIVTCKKPNNHYRISNQEIDQIQKSSNTVNVTMEKCFKNSTNREK